MNLIELIIVLVRQNKYILLFISFLIERHSAGLIAAVLASKNQLNIYIVFLLLIFSEILVDSVVFLLGKTLTEGKLQKKLSKYEHNGFLKAIKEIIDRHPVRALFFAKIIGIISVPTIILIGKYRSVKLKKFILLSSIIGFFKNLVIIFLGYGLGLSLETLLGGYDVFAIVTIIVSVLIVGYIVFRINKRKIQSITIKALKKI